MIKKSLTAFDLKILALVLMFFDHLAYFMGNYLPATWVLTMHWAGRIVMPIFVFLVVESFFKTRSRKKYITRLYAAALVMATGNYLMFWLVQDTLHPSWQYRISLNVFLSLALGISAIACAEKSKDAGRYNKILLIAGFYILSLIALFTESSFIGLACFYIFYFLRGTRYMWGAYVLFCLAWVVGNMFTIPILNSFYSYQWLMICALPLFWLYNGRLGLGAKYLFYIFYPLHIWILYFLAFYFASR